MEMKVRGIGGPPATVETALLIAVPCFACLINMLFFANVAHTSGVLMAANIYLVVAVITVAVFMQRQRRLSFNTFARKMLLLVVFALASSSAAGFIAFEKAYQHYWCLHERNSYVNVLATEPAAQFADAGKVVFADGTRIDSQRSLGYKDGKTFCVAPVMDEQSGGAVEFWAVGNDCCQVRGSFWCDDAWNYKARAGVVYQDVTGQFMAAVRQAEAAFELAASAEPLLVRWVKEPERVEWNHRVIGNAILISCFLITTLIVALVTISFDSGSGLRL